MRASSVDEKKKDDRDFADKLTDYVAYGIILSVASYLTLFGVFIFRDLFGAGASTAPLSDWVILGLMGATVLLIVSLIIFALLVKELWKPGKSEKVNKNAIVAPTVAFKKT